MLATLFYTIGEAAYELVKKRTFLMMSVIMGLYSIVLVFLLCYFILGKWKGGPPNENGDEDEQKQKLINGV